MEGRGGDMGGGRDGDQESRGGRERRWVGGGGGKRARGRGEGGGEMCERGRACVCVYLGVCV